MTTTTDAIAFPPPRQRDNKSVQRALAAIVLVNFVSLAGFGLMFPVFAIYSRQIGASGIEIAASVAAFSFGQFLSSPLWGRWSDRWGRRPVMIAGLAAGALIYLLHLFVTTPEILLAVRFASGLATGSFAVTFAVASDISTRENRTHIMGIVSAGFSLGFIFGPAIGGFSASMIGDQDAFAFVCIVGAALGLVATALTWMLLRETRPHNLHAEASSAGGLALFRLRGFAAPVVISFFAAGAFAKMESILGLFADDVLGLDPLGIGLMFGCMGTVTTICQFTVTGRIARSAGERGMLYLSLGIIGAGMALLGSAHGLGLAAAGLTCTSIGFALVNPALSGLVSLATPADAQGVGLGVMQSASALGRIVGPLAAGFLYDLQGASAPLYWGAGILFATLMVTPLLRLPDARTAR